MNYSIAVFVLFICLMSVVDKSAAHSGRTAARDGCHFCRTNCKAYGYTENTRHSHTRGKRCLDSNDPLHNPKKSLTQKAAKRTKAGQGVMTNTSSYNKFTYNDSTRNKLLPLYLKNHGATFYCSCKFNKHKDVDHKSCGFSYFKKDNGTKFIQWEHIVPQSVIKRYFESRPPLGDMHNIVPAVGKINNIRSNYPFRVIEGETRRFGKCDFETKSGVAEAKESIRGNIARIYFYMESKYNIKIDDVSRKLFIKWDKLDPPDKWECDRNILIEKIQGNSNTFVTNGCLARWSS
ncbi:MAG: endonuclease [Bacteriovoracaceae bacterium]|nr:endonuclease [Bacteriovoracaceae bacterium]